MKETKLKDSGNRTSFGTDAKRDIQVGNGRFDLMPHSIIAELILIPGCGELETETCISKIFSSISAFQITARKEALYGALQYVITLKANNDGIDYEEAMYEMIRDLAKHYEQGALKYAPRNWEKGLPLHSFIDSALRHITKYMLSWDDEPHLVACMWNIVGCIYTFENLDKSLDDFTKKKEE